MSTQTAIDHYDLLIVGAGPVGSSLAQALANTTLNIGLVEAGTPFAAQSTQNLDNRAIALSYGSYRIFKSIGLWPALAPHALPLQQVHVSDQGHFGKTRLSAKHLDVPALGYVIEAHILNQILAQSLQHRARLTLISPAKVHGLSASKQGFNVALATREGEKKVSTRLLVAADGQHSTIRQLQQIQQVEWDYGQSAIVTTARAQQDTQGTAYERFTTMGPLALLPMTDNRYGVVWTIDNAHLEALLALDETAFLKQLQHHFGHRVGRFLAVGSRQHYPLVLSQAKTQTQQNLVLLGNAAHTLHPIAGQGFNLGLRDAATLAHAIKSAPNLDDPTLLSNYAKARKRDQCATIAFTDGLIRLFSNDFLPLVTARNTGLLLLDGLPLAKQHFAFQGMGLLLEEKN